MSPVDNNSNHSFSSCNESELVKSHSQNETKSALNNHLIEDIGANQLSYSPSVPPPPPYLQMQQFLQQHIFSSNQLEQLVRSHSYYLQQLQQQKNSKVSSPTSPSPHPMHGKGLEQMMSSLQEQIQMNLLQQSNFLNSQKISPPGTGGTKKEMQQNALLQQQHQELLQQMQLVQRQYMMHQGLNLPSLASQRQDFNFPHGISTGHSQKPPPSSLLSNPEKALRTHHNPINANNATDHYHEPAVTPVVPANEFNNDKIGHLVKQILLGKNIELAHMLNGVNHSPILNGAGGPDDVDGSIHPLFGSTGEGHGTCKWPSCEIAFEDFATFMR